MRETKDQTIIRLKREVAKLKDEIKNQKQISKEKLKESKVILAQSQSKSKTDFKEQINRYKSDYNKLKAMYDRLFDKYYTQILRTSRHKRNALFYMELDIGLNKELYEQIKKDNCIRLDAYRNGDILDPHGNLYFFDDNLMLTINPQTGERLTLSQLAQIYNLLKTQSQYLSAVEEVAEFRKHNNDVEYLRLINSRGRELFEKFYPHLF